MRLIAHSSLFLSQVPIHPRHYPQSFPRNRRQEDVVRVDADDIAELAGGARARGDRVHWAVGVAGDEGEHLEAAPAEDALGRSEAGFAPLRIDGGAFGAAADLEVGERLAHRG